jgi:hypothetical protein
MSSRDGIWIPPMLLLAANRILRVASSILSKYAIENTDDSIAWAECG